MSSRFYNTGKPIAPGNYTGAFSFAANVEPAYPGKGQVVDLYTTPGTAPGRDDGMFTNMHLRGRPKPKTHLGQNATRSDGMVQEGFRFKMGSTKKEEADSFVLKRESFTLKKELMNDRDFDEGLANDSLGFGQKQSMDPRLVQAAQTNNSAARMRFVGGLDDV